MEVNRALVLFATHCLELMVLVKQGSGAVNRHLSVSEHGGETVFLHRVEEGAASRSYGLHVARLAGVPSSVVERAQILIAPYGILTTARNNLAEFFTGNSGVASIFLREPC